MKNIMPRWLVCTLLFFCCAFFVLFIICIREYPKFDVDYSDLTREELTFQSYEEKPGAETGPTYYIHFKEYPDPFRIDNITSKKVNKQVLKSLNENQKLLVYYTQDAESHYKEICELKTYATPILTLSNYIRVNQNNQLAGMVFSPIMIVSTLLIIAAGRREAKRNETTARAQSVYDAK